MRRKIFSLLLSLALVGAVASLQSQNRLPDFRNLMVVGDSLAAGFMNNSLNQKGQNDSFAAQFARQVGTYLFLPLISEPGIPNELELIDVGPPPVIQAVGGPSGTRVLPTLFPQNLAVPGQKVVDALTARPELPIDTLEDIILGLPSLVIPEIGIPPLSQIEMAVALKPTFTLFWLGPGDALGGVTEADPAAVTDLQTFQELYGQALGALLTLTESQVMVANIPDVTLTPFLFSAETIAQIAGAPLALIGPALGIAEGDFVTGFGLDLVTPILQGEQEGPLPANVVLTAEEVRIIRTQVATMNLIIAQTAGQLGVPLVDVAGFFDELHAGGMLIAGVPVSTDLFGGIFSLDGIHPTITGHALIADLFVQKLNETFAMAVPAVDVESVALRDPLFPANLPQEAALVGSFRRDERSRSPFGRSEPKGKVEKRSKRPRGSYQRP